MKNEAYTSVTYYRYTMTEEWLQHGAFSTLPKKRAFWLRMINVRLATLGSIQFIIDKRFYT